MMEFSSADEMMAHYKAMRARMRNLKAPPPPPPPVVLAPPRPTSQNPTVPKDRLHWWAPRVERIWEPLPPVIRAYPSVRRIQNALCEWYKFSHPELIAARRTKSVCRARQIGYYLCKILTPLSLPAIAHHFGGRDHTTILHGARKIEKLIAIDPAFAAEVEDLKQALQG